MSLGIKSYYVDILSKFKDSHFSNFKYFVSHGHQDAIKCLDYWKSVNEKYTKVSMKKCQLTLVTFINELELNLFKT